jgi:hypothetical protein
VTSEIPGTRPDNMPAGCFGKSLNVQRVGWLGSSGEVSYAHPSKILGATIRARRRDGGRVPAQGVAPHESKHRNPRETAPRRWVIHAIHFAPFVCFVVQDGNVRPGVATLKEGQGALKMDRSPLRSPDEHAAGHGTPSVGVAFAANLGRHRRPILATVRERARFLQRALPIRRPGIWAHLWLGPDPLAS